MGKLYVTFTQTKKLHPSPPFPKILGNPSKNSLDIASRYLKPPCEQPCSEQRSVVQSWQVVYSIDTVDWPQFRLQRKAPGVGSLNPVRQGRSLRHYYS